MPVRGTLNETLGTLPSGRVLALSDAEMTKYLRENYRTDTDARRRKDMRMRLDLYRDRGRPHFTAVIDRVFDDQKVKEWRKRFVYLAEFQNVTKRIVREVSAVYSEPARRRLAGKAATEAYRQLVAEIRLDRRMRQVNRLGNLLNNVLVEPVVRMGDAHVDVTTPDKFAAVAHPNDPTLAVGYVIDQFPATKHRPIKATEPHYRVVDGQTTFFLDREWRMVEGTRQPHGLGRIPALLYSREEHEDCLLDGKSGGDVISGHLAIALLNTLMLRDQKSGTKQAYATGDLSTTAVGQPMDPEHVFQLGEGVTINTLDLGADPSVYINATRAVIKQLAANWGIPESVFDLSYQATSGYEIELKRTGLREIRRDQILDFRPFERELAVLLSDVLKAHGHAGAFEPKGWRIDFGESEIPRDPNARIQFYKAMEELDLMDRADMFQHENPEATRDEALEEIADNHIMRIERMRDFHASNPTAFGPRDSGPHAPPDRNGQRMSADQDMAREAEKLAREVLDNAAA